MTILIILSGALMVLAGVSLIVKPELIFNLLRDKADEPWLHVSAVVVRLILGLLLIYQAGVSKFPLAIHIIGWIAVVAAIILSVIGRNNFKRLIAWAFSLARPFPYIGGALGMGFGLFLVYAFI